MPSTIVYSQFFILFFLFIFKCHAQQNESVAGLTLDELEMLDDFELKLLRDFVKHRGKGSVSKASKDEDIQLFGPAKDMSTATETVDLSSLTHQINPAAIQMPDEFKPLSVAQAAPHSNKKPKLKIRRKGSVDKPKKDEQSVPVEAKLAEKPTLINPLNTSPNGLREEDNEQTNRSDDLSGEDYEKLAKLLQTFVNRRKNQPPSNEDLKSSLIPTLMPLISNTKLLSATLPPWAVTQKVTTQRSRIETPRGLSKITEQEDNEEATFVVNDDKMSKPELASVWHEHKTTSLPPSKKMKEKEDSFDIDSKLSLVDSEVERDPKDWEIKMRQLSRELSSILHRLKNEKDQKLPKTEHKVAIQNFNLIPNKSTTKPTKTTLDPRTIFDINDNANIDESEVKEKNDEEEEEQQEDDSLSKQDITQRLTLSNLKINRKTLPAHQGSTGGKAYVTILREGIARQTDINEYVFIASITLIRDSNKVILVDTGLATDINGRTDLLTKLSKLDIAPPNVDYVVTTHGHPDHAGNTNDFPDAVHFQGNMLHYHSKFNFSDLFEKDLHQLTPNVQLIKTPGHTPDDITVMVRNTDKYGSIAVSGDVFVAEEDMRFPLMWKPMAWSERTQETSRKRLICDADYIVPGHGKVFKVTDKMRNTFKC